MGTTPQECALVVGLRLVEESYAQLALGVMAQAEYHGVLVVREAQLGDLAHACGARRYITLVTREAGGEFVWADGGASPEETIASIPPRFHGTLDLTFCESAPLGQLARQRRPDAKVLEDGRRIGLPTRLISYARDLEQLAAAT